MNLAFALGDTDTTVPVRGAWRDGVPTEDILFKVPPHLGVSRAYYLTGPPSTHKIPSVTALDFSSVTHFVAQLQCDEEEEDSSTISHPSMKAKILEFRFHRQPAQTTSTSKRVIIPNHRCCFCAPFYTSRTACQTKVRCYNCNDIAGGAWCGIQSISGHTR